MVAHHVKQQLVCHERDLYPWGRLKVGRQTLPLRGEVLPSLAQRQEIIGLKCHEASSLLAGMAIAAARASKPHPVLASLLSSEITPNSGCSFP
jgi:hypothetical protein